VTLGPTSPARAPLDTEVEIETPEHIVFRHRIAGPARRAVAHVIDLVICYGVVVGIAFVVAIGSFGSGDFTGGFGVGLLLLMLFAAQWLYFVVLEAWKGTTPGKRSMGLRVVTTEGRPIGFVAAALRNVVRAADVLPSVYLVGLVSMTITRRFQRLGDLVAGTMVVVVERTAGTRHAIRPTFGARPRPDELAALPDLVVLDADERDALELFARRRGTLGEARERELAEIIAGPLFARLDVRFVDPVRGLTLLYERALESGRAEAPVSSRAQRGASGWR
jgi:uncharacterized RDD family membrane protein YckC